MVSAELPSTRHDRWWLLALRVPVLLSVLFWAGSRGPDHLSAKAEVPQIASDSLRISIFDLSSPSSVTVLSEDELIVKADGEIVRSSGVPLTFERSDTSISSSISSNRSEYRISADNRGALTVYVNGDDSATRTYTGSLLIVPDPDDAGSLVIVNKVPIEDYVAAVVASEYGLDDLEGSRAMAVLARTYALKSKAGSGDLYDHVDHSMSQVFRGVDRIDWRSNEAATTTRGLVLVHNGELVESVYHSSSGGHTANNEDVWNGSPVAYLRGRKDRYEDSPHSDWTTRVDRARLLTILSNRVQVAVNGIKVSSRSRDGRVSMLTLVAGGGDREISANDFRLMVIREFGSRTLRSTMFDVRRRGAEYVFEGHGFGHGVGLSQWGAHRMAQAGKSYEEILAYYYVDVDLVSIGGVNAVERLPSRPAEVSPEPQKTSIKRRGW